MAITKKQTKQKVEDAFISGAPDSSGEPRHVKKGKKVQITLTIALPLLTQVDALANKLGQSRAGIINLAIHQSLEHGVRFDGNTAQEA